MPIAKYRGTKHVVARSSAEKLASNDIQTSKAGIAAGEACYEEVCVCVYVCAWLVERWRPFVLKKKKKMFCLISEVSRLLDMLYEHAAVNNLFQKERRGEKI